MNSNVLVKDKILKGYIDAMIWSTSDTDPITGEELESLEGFEISDDLKKQAEELCEKFYRLNFNSCIFYYHKRQPDIGWCAWESLGHDLWLTSAGHGTGFWDRDLGDLGETLTEACKHLKKDAYLGDDGLIYFL